MTFCVCSFVLAQDLQLIQNCKIFLIPCILHCVTKSKRVLNPKVKVVTSRQDYGYNGLWNYKYWLPQLRRVHSPFTTRHYTYPTPVSNILIQRPNFSFSPVVDPLQVHRSFFGGLCRDNILHWWKFSWTVFSECVNWRFMRIFCDLFC